ncbi:Outer membrane protein beta-barrel domain-containing protein [Aquiflexum balticum DSM 16537]|uniref:Outer membrane protein beta-barrel domain-containing protein n=1 Tax=Aquiflexum balticum DSM 16537 TaxID=758820 RepID=A0A1W2H8W2_9BACT|nr:outer membrane beta-barrel protein [Aquiflexum balticum]SMD45224.1 Outer membrane protein beta-barrel domain-containing protein [Aquiflexum balticum DSM 16537]
MKKLLLVLTLSFLSLPQLMAQGVEITPFTGYTFQAGFNISGGRAFLRDGQTWGGMMGFSLNEATEVELGYSYMGTSAVARSNSLQENIDIPAQVHYATIGANRLFPTSDKMTFFAGGKLGTGTVAFPDGEYRNITKFAVGFQGGMKYYASDRVGIRLQANLMMPIVGVGTSLWWSPGSGTAVGLSGWSPIAQFGFTGGLVFRLQQ